MVAIKYNVNSAKLLLKNKNITSDHAYEIYSGGSIVTYCVQYAPELFDDILQWEYLPDDFLDVDYFYMMHDIVSSDEYLKRIYLTTLAFIAVKNPKIFHKILTSKIDLNTHLNNDVITIDSKIFSIIEVTYLYSPVSFQYLIGSKYIKNITYDVNFFAKYATTQPYSWYIFVTSTIFTENNFDEIHDTSLDDYGHSVYSGFKPNNISNHSHYIQTTHEYADSAANMCEVCGIGKKKILFGCARHLTCVACAIKLPNCPDCRNNENNKRYHLLN